MEEGNSLKFIVLYNKKEEGYNLKSIEMTRIILAENEKKQRIGADMLVGVIK